MILLPGVWNPAGAREGSGQSGGESTVLKAPVAGPFAGAGVRTALGELRMGSWPVNAAASASIGLADRHAASLEGAAARLVPVLGKWEPSPLSVWDCGFVPDTANACAAGPGSRGDASPIEVGAPVSAGSIPRESVEAAAAGRGAGVARREPAAVAGGLLARKKVLSAEGGALSGAAAAAVRKAIDKKHRKPRARRPQVREQEEREDFCLESELDALIPLLPEETVLSMLGGERGMAQVPAVRRAEHLRRRLRARAGASGERIARCRLLLGRVRKYAATVLGLPESQWDAAVFPMTAALGHEIIHDAHVTALAEGTKKGSAKGGATVGNGVRADLVRAAQVLGWPIECDKEAWQTAAPLASVGCSKKAGTLPLAAKCQLEWFADGNLPESITGTARTACQFYSRSLLTGGLDVGVRIAEGVRVHFSPDATNPEDVVCGVASMGKDGAPIEIYSVAEGFLGVYEWWPAHLRECLELGQVFPEWERPHGSKGCITRAGRLTHFLAEPDRVRGALPALLSLPPLAYSGAELEKMNLKGHSLHASNPDWGGLIGQRPDFEGVALDRGLEHGFDDADRDALGNWLRDAGAKSEASAAEAARAAPAGGARLAAAVASLPGRRSSRGAMRVYYGQGGAGGTRFGQRALLLSVRQRLARTVRRVGRQGLALSPAGPSGLGDSPAAPV